MSDTPLLDIAALDNWLGFRPGMGRAQVVERLKALDITDEDCSGTHVATNVEDHDIEFHFATDGSERLRQVSVDDAEIRWNGRPLLDQRLDAALRVLEPLGRSPMWEANDACYDPFPDPAKLPAGPVSDEELFEQGTVWLPERGLGLSMSEGEVIGVVWRETQDVPTRFVGPVTEAQRELSRRPDLEEYLREKRRVRNRTAAPKSATGPAGTVLTWICIAALVLIARKGFHEAQVWHTATTLQGRFISMEEVPRKKHLDLAPESVRQHMPDDPVRRRAMYHIEYLDPTGRSHTAVIEAAELYVSPHEVGEKVPIAYVEGDPPRVKGLSGANNAAFVEYMPWAMAVGAFWVVMQFVLGMVPRTWRTVVKLLLASGTKRDSDRPELR